jgi:hypothetical protein
MFFPKWDEGGTTSYAVFFSNSVKHSTKCMINAPDTMNAYLNRDKYKSEHYIHAHTDPDTDYDYIFRGKGMRSLEFFYMLNLYNGVYDRREDKNNNIRLTGKLTDKTDIVGHPCNYKKDGGFIKTPEYFV